MELVSSSRRALHLLQVETSEDRLPRTECRYIPVGGAGSGISIALAKRTRHPNLILAICSTSLLIVGMNRTTTIAPEAGAEQEVVYTALTTCGPPFPGNLHLNNEYILLSRAGPRRLPKAPPF
jgi:hypothetical protein